jgi:hypothetical protein
MSRFYENKTRLDSLMHITETDKHLDSLFRIPPDSGLPELLNTYPNISRELVELGITDASSHSNTYRPVGRWYYLKTNWSKDYPIYLIYNLIDQGWEHNRNESILDSSENIKGFHKIDKNHNETWGLGGKWKMFRLVKEIADVKT